MCVWHVTLCTTRCRAGPTLAMSRSGSPRPDAPSIEPPLVFQSARSDEMRCVMWFALGHDDAGHAANGPASSSSRCSEMTSPIQRRPDDAEEDTRWDDSEGPPRQKPRRTHPPSYTRDDRRPSRARARAVFGVRSAPRGGGPCRARRRRRSRRCPSRWSLRRTPSRRSRRARSSPRRWARRRHAGRARTARGRARRTSSSWPAGEQTAHFSTGCPLQTWPWGGAPRHALM